jgi:hypothetical protein
MDVESVSFGVSTARASMLQLKRRDRAYGLIETTFTSRGSPIPLHGNKANASPVTL